MGTETKINCLTAGPEGPLNFKDKQLTFDLGLMLYKRNNSVKVITDSYVL